VVLERARIQEKPHTCKPVSYPDPTTGTSERYRGRDWLHAGWIPGMFGNQILVCTLASSFRRVWSNNATVHDIYRSPTVYLHESLGTKYECHD